MATKPNDDTTGKPVGEGDDTASDDRDDLEDQGGDGVSGDDEPGDDEGEDEGEGGDDDPGADDGDGEPDPLAADDEGDGDGDEPEPHKAGEGEGGKPRASRGDRRFGRLSRQNQELREQLAEVKGRLDGIGRTQPQQRGMSPEERRQYLSTLTADERTDFLLNEQRQYFDQTMRQVVGTTQDSGDRAEFSSFLATRPRFAKLATAVETRLEQIRRGDPVRGIPGMNVTRRAVLRQILGERAEAAMEQGEGKNNRQRAKERVRRETTKPVDTRGEGAGQRRRTGKTAEDRLLTGGPGGGPVEI